MDKTAVMNLALYFAAIAALILGIIALVKFCKSSVLVKTIVRPLSSAPARKITVLLATLFPALSVLFLIAFIILADSNKIDAGLYLFGFLYGVGYLFWMFWYFVYYTRHMRENSRIEDNRSLWIAGLIVAYPIPAIIYWYRYIWKDSAKTQ